MSPALGNELNKNLFRPPYLKNFDVGALIFGGRGTWKTEVESLEQIFKSHGVSYEVVDSDEINSMTLDQFSRFGAIVWPGGKAGKQAASLKPETKENLRRVVQERGVSWIGFCAGAFIAVEQQNETDYPYGLKIAVGSKLPYYFLEEQLNKSDQADIAMTLVTFADGSKRDLVWYGGPTTPSGAGIVVAKYPTGDPAISQLWSGRGLVLLSGPHPAVPQSVRDEFGLNDIDGPDFDLTWTLLRSAILRIELPKF